MKIINRLKGLNFSDKSGYYMCDGHISILFYDNRTCSIFKDKEFIENVSNDEIIEKILKIKKHGKIC